MGGGGSCLLSNAWQDDVAFALGNVQNPTKSHSGGLCSLSQHFRVMDRALGSPRSHPLRLKMPFVDICGSLSFLPPGRWDAAGLRG